MTDGTSSITCPECGTLNRPGSAFCAECGAMLSSPENNDTNATASFTPVQNDKSSAAWQPDDTATTQLFTPQVGTDDAAPPMDTSLWTEPSSVVQTVEPLDPGRRGFILGVIATILILLVFGFFLWANVASDGFRDTITGVF